MKAVLQRSSYQHSRFVKGGVANHYILSERKYISSSMEYKWEIDCSIVPMFCFYLSLERDHLAHSMRSSAIIFMAGAEIPLFSSQKLAMILIHFFMQTPGLILL